jgi:hypothetical protein
MQYIDGLVYLVLSILPFLEQSVFSSVLRNICLEKVCEIFMETTRLEHLPNASRITFIAIMVWELWKSQVDATVLPESWNSFCWALCSTTLTTEYGKVFYTKVAEDFIRFSTK